MTSSNAHDRLEIPLYFVKTDLTVFKHNLKYQIQVICKIEGSPQSKKEGPKSLPKELMLYGTEPPASCHAGRNKELQRQILQRH